MIPLGVVLRCFLALLSRMAFLLTGGLSPNRRTVLAWLCALFTLPSAGLALVNARDRDGGPRAVCVHQLRELAGAKDSTWPLKRKGRQAHPWRGAIS